MVQVAEGARWRDNTIQQIIFSSPEIFSEGHVCTAGEASALNQTLAENLRNNFAPVIKEAREAAAKANNLKIDEVTNDHLDIAALQEEFKEYVTSYEFGVRTGGSRTPMDPVEREAMRIAVEKVRGAIKAKGMTISDFPKEKIDELAQGLIAANPQITEEAQRRVAAVKDVSGISLEGLSLNPTVPVTSPSPPEAPAA